MASRRSVLIGLGSLVAGGGALLGTGAFTTVTAERTVNVETAGDASAFLGLAPADRDDSEDGTQNEYVADPGDGTLEITLENTDENTPGNATGLNQNAITVFRNLVTVTNNGTQEVTSIELDFIEGNLSDGELDDVFSFTVLEDGDRATVSNGDDILTGENDIPDGLGPGSTINFGLEIDLLDDSSDSDVTEIPADSSFTLEITAETENSQ